MNWFRSQISNNDISVTPTTTTSTRSYLMKGDKGDAVKKLQENLNYLGYPCGTADGSFGSKTETALKNFQKTYKLTVDGKYGSTSKKTLESAVKKKKNATTSTKKFVHNNLDYSLVFDPIYYSNKYSDLKAAFGTNATKLFEHFIEYGRVEGRQAISTFNPVAYKNRYPDLQELFGDNMASYYNHYILYGKQEDRKGI
jgi:peptidoglycan hydrolase-like protein with peptidoglycan-binding domain